MTPTPHGQVPEALRLAHIFDNQLPPEWPDMVAAAAELRRQHTRIAELEAEVAAVGAGGVQALSAAPASLSESIDQLERKLAIIGVVGAIDGHDVVRRESVLEIARRAAIAAQGGKT